MRGNYAFVLTFVPVTCPVELITGEADCADLLASAAVLASNRWA